jgi:hypothetical protein
MTEQEAAEAIATAVVRARREIKQRAEEGKADQRRRRSQQRSCAPKAAEVGQAESVVKK